MTKGIGCLLVTSSNLTTRKCEFPNQPIRVLPIFSLHCSSGGTFVANANVAYKWRTKKGRLQVNIRNALDIHMYSLKVN